MSSVAYIRHVFLDASALVGYLLDPDIVQAGGDKISNYIHRPGRLAYTNQPCITETFTVLKRMRNKRELNEAGYAMRVSLLKSNIEGKTIRVSEFPYLERSFFEDALSFVAKYPEIDFLDAVQLVDITKGPFKIFAEESRTMLITADKALSAAARSEGIQTWYSIDEPLPD